MAPSRGLIKSGHVARRLSTTKGIKMSNDKNNADQSEPDEALEDSPELTDAELDQVAGAGYPQGEKPPDYTRWGIGG